MSREQRLRQISAIEESSRRFLEQQEQIREAESKRLQDELDRRTKRDSSELRNMKEKELLKKLEMQANLKLQEMKSMRDTVGRR